MNIRATGLLCTTVLALHGWSVTTLAAELWVIKAGVLNKESLIPSATKVAKDHVNCGGKTVNGLYVVPTKIGSLPNWARFITAKSAVGDCEFRVVFSCAVSRPKWRFPNITVSDRGRLYFWKPGSPIILSPKRMSLPLKGFDTAIKNGPFDGKIHSLAIKRVGNKLACFYDGKKLNEQPIDPNVRLHLWFDALGATCKIKSIKLTAQQLSDNLTTAFKSAAPIAEIYRGSQGLKKPLHGKAVRYRIPALAVSRQGTILAFAEARRISGADVGDIDAVVKRSTDGGKTWGPEIVIMDAKGLSVNNPCPIVDPKTGRICVMMGRFAPGGGLTVTHFVSYSNDDGKTWSKPKDIGLRAQSPAGVTPTLPGPGAGIVLERGKYSGRFIAPINYGVAGTTAPGVAYSDDRGETWKVGGMCKAGVLMVEARGVELLNGSLLFNARTVNKKRGITVLPAGGLKDTKKMRYAELPDPSCQGAIMRYSWPKGDRPGLILYSGPASIHSRANGTLWGSYDDAQTWPWKVEYYQGPSGYSDVCMLRDGRVAVLFEKDGKSNLGFTILPAPPATP